MIIAFRGHLEISTDIYNGQSWGLGAARICLEPRFSLPTPPV
jgi:hypothetical protein